MSIKFERQTLQVIVEFSKRVSLGDLLSFRDDFLFIPDHPGQLKPDQKERSLTRR